MILLMVLNEYIIDLSLLLSTQMTLRLSTTVDPLALTVLLITILYYGSCLFSTYKYTTRRYRISSHLTKTEFMRYKPNISMRKKIKL